MKNQMNSTPISFLLSHLALWISIISIEIFFVYCSLQLLSPNDVQLQPDSCFHTLAKALSSLLYSADALFSTPRHSCSIEPSTQDSTPSSAFTWVSMPILTTFPLVFSSFEHWPLCSLDAFFHIQSQFSCFVCNLQMKPPANKRAGQN